MDDSAAMITSSLCALMRGETVDPPAAQRADFDTQARRALAYHGIGPLLSRELARAGFAHPPRGFEFLFPDQTDKDETAIELVRRHELVRVLRTLAEAGVSALLLKGAALAYSRYPSPALRPRADTDLLIRETERAVADRVLTELGYSKPNAISGDLIKYQCGYALRDRFRIEHLLDVHWRISNTQLFSRTLAFDELWQRSMAIPMLGEHARGLAAADALLHACMHRAHHMHSPFYVDDAPLVGGDRLIWLYDMHLLLKAMPLEERANFARLAVERKMGAVCRDALMRAHQCFGTRIEEGVLLALQNPGVVEPSEACLRRGAVRHLLTELRALPRWGDRAAYLREHLFPPAEYMLAKYAVANRAWLPMLYLQRGIQGAWKKVQGR